MHLGLHKFCLNQFDEVVVTTISHIFEDFNFIKICHSLFVPSRRRQELGAKEVTVCDKIIPSGLSLRIEMSLECLNQILASTSMLGG